MNTLLTIIRGLPGAGKSELAKKIQKEKGGVIIDPDDLLYDNGVYCYTDERYANAFQNCLESLRALTGDVNLLPQIIFADVLPTLFEVKTVIRSYQVLNLFKPNNLISVIDLNITKAESMQRNTHNVRESDIDRMIELWEPFEGWEA